MLNTLNCKYTFIRSRVHWLNIDPPPPPRLFVPTFLHLQSLQFTASAVRIEVHSDFVFQAVFQN